jgi:hypothetical protein
MLVSCRLAGRTVLLQLFAEASACLRASSQHRCITQQGSKHCISTHAPAGCVAWQKYPGRASSSQQWLPAHLQPVKQ